MVFIYVQNMWSVFLHILKRYIFAGLQVRNVSFADPIAKGKTHLKSKAWYLLFIYLGLKKCGFGFLSFIIKLFKKLQSL